jgi:hypothetical protein
MVAGSGGGRGVTECFLWLLHLTSMRAALVAHREIQHDFEDSLAAIDIEKMRTGEYWRDVERQKGAA